LTFYPLFCRKTGKSKCEWSIDDPCDWRDSRNLFSICLAATVSIFSCNGWWGKRHVDISMVRYGISCTCIAWVTTRDFCQCALSTTSWGKYRDSNQYICDLHLCSDTIEITK